MSLSIVAVADGGGCNEELERIVLFEVQTPTLELLL